VRSLQTEPLGEGGNRTGWIFLWTSREIQKTLFYTYCESCIFDLKILLIIFTKTFVFWITTNFQNTNAIISYCYNHMVQRTNVNIAVCIDGSLGFILFNFHPMSRIFLFSHLKCGVKNTTFAVGIKQIIIPLRLI